MSNDAPERHEMHPDQPAGECGECGRTVWPDNAQWLDDGTVLHETCATHGVGPDGFWRPRLSDVKADLAKAQARIAELEAALALRTGADHDEDCKSHRDRDCNCGHVEAVRALRAALTKRDGMRHAHDCQIGQGGYCDCGNSYQCVKLTKQCYKTPFGSLSKADCDAAC